MNNIVLVGNPNCGKTTLFNALTGAHQKVGNWPGVTVEKKTGLISLSKTQAEITDLPGIYSLALTKEGHSQDEEIAVKTLSCSSFDLIINVVDACRLERHLYLSSQLLELGIPVIIVLNMMDIAKEADITINVPLLSQQMGCPIIPIQAHKKIGLERVKLLLEKTIPSPKPLELELPTWVRTLKENVQHQFITQNNLSSRLAAYHSFRALEGDNSLLEINVTDVDMIMADARYEQIHQLVEKVQTKKSDASNDLTANIDKIFLNRYFALPLFLGIMYLMFLVAINLGGAVQDFFDISTDTIFVKAPAYLLGQIHSPSWLIALVADGVGKGINTTLTFIPVIASMFFCLSILETTGYMARAAFVVDKLMRRLGLPGKSFVPMIVGFGCNVPAIMAARTLDTERDRLLTILMAPFMSCSARLAIYAVFVAAFFSSGGQNVVFLLYLIGIIAAILTGLLLRKTLLKGTASPLIIDLPLYHKPSMTRLCRETSLRLRYFIMRAGKIIIPVAVLLGILNIKLGSTSILAQVGQWLTPLFSPMGIQIDNWPATVGLLTGALAKEVVVGSLNTLYSQGGDVHTTMLDFNFWGSLGEALTSIPRNLMQLGQAISNPILASAPTSDVSQSVYGIMASRFDGQAGAFAYLLFVLLYIPCISTMAAIRHEANKRLMWFSIVWSLLVAYAASVCYYQAARFTLHPETSIFWMVSLAMTLILFFYGLRYWGLNSETNHVISHP